MATVTADRFADYRALDDEALVGYVCAGELDLFTILVERHYDAVSGFLCRRLDDPELAADLVQETFLDAFCYLDRRDADRLFVTWLYGIAHNKVRMSWRYQRLHHVISFDGLSESKPTPPLVLTQTNINDSCLEQELLNQVLAGLGPASRDVLLLNCEDGFTALEIAHILGISRPAAERRLSRAKQHFREEYTRLNGEARC